MKNTGARMAVKALEDEGVRFLFGIPGTHNLDLYDAIEDSNLLDAILVTDEQSAGFMADAVWRTSSQLAVVNLVPGAGVTHALSGIAEAFLDHAAMLVLTSGIRSDTGRSFQLHDIDQLALLRPVTKAVFRVETANQVYPLLRQAARLARAGAPGPVAVEIPTNLYLFTEEMGELTSPADLEVPFPSPGQVDQAIRMLSHAEHPALYVGNGAKAASTLLVTLAERLGAPVVTTIQGKGVFPERHSLWLWNNFGRTAPDFVQRIMDRCDCLMAIGCRFSEVATGSYGITPPKRLIHVDIDEKVFHRNFPAALAIRADARAFVEAVLTRLPSRRPLEGLQQEIAAGHAALRARWMGESSRGRVTPARFLEALSAAVRPQAIFVTDSGNGTFLAMEHLRLEAPGCFIGPIDYSCMGYAVPGAIGARLARPDRDVIALAGDGALLMTGLELLTAASWQVAPVVFVLRDGQLSQIAQFQSVSLGRTVTVALPDYRTDHLAATVGAEYLRIDTDPDIVGNIAMALSTARGGRPVLVEVMLDPSFTTFFTKGVLETNFWRLPWAERLRRVSRFVTRRVRS